MNDSCIFLPVWKLAMEGYVYQKSSIKILEMMMLTLGIFSMLVCTVTFLLGKLWECNSISKGLSVFHSLAGSLTHSLSSSAHFSA